MKVPTINETVMLIYNALNIENNYDVPTSANTLNINSCY